jgi:energy-coupling factor transporter transmembrane protein EcfT
MALIVSRAHLMRILRRSRWLLLSMLLLFGWMTPGTILPGVPGATQEGLLLAAENVARLMIAIATVSVLLAILAPEALVSGMRSLLVPLAGLGGFRDRLAVRLMLTLEAVEAAHQGSESYSATSTRLCLPVLPVRLADYAATVSGIGLMLYAVMA